eukprot:TRINITY_DN6841_c0_g1_i1.p1 TRINITY_DN6841_c0_g1~~TRINITY_DN6841_c0_g1_i1.p1  ORF type:complete len:514 (-),score=76.18 TRINITY_DN6841_c0_g1_i1:13-1554(-)
MAFQILPKDLMMVMLILEPKIVLSCKELLQFEDMMWKKFCSARFLSYYIAPFIFTRALDLRSLDQRQRKPNMNLPMSTWKYIYRSFYDLLLRFNHQEARCFFYGPRLVISSLSPERESRTYGQCPIDPLLENRTAEITAFMKLLMCRIISRWPTLQFTLADVNTILDSHVRACPPKPMVSELDRDPVVVSIRFIVDEEEYQFGPQPYYTRPALELTIPIPRTPPSQNQLLIHFYGIDTADFEPRNLQTESIPLHRISLDDLGELSPFVQQVFRLMAPHVLYLHKLSSEWNWRLRSNSWDHQVALNPHLQMMSDVQEEMTTQLETKTVIAVRLILEAIDQSSKHTVIQFLDHLGPQSRSKKPSLHLRQATERCIRRKMRFELSDHLAISGWGYPGLMDEFFGEFKAKENSQECFPHYSTHYSERPNPHHGCSRWVLALRDQTCKDRHNTTPKWWTIFSLQSALDVLPFIVKWVESHLHVRMEGSNQQGIDQSQQEMNAILQKTSPQAFGVFSWK